VDLELYLRVLWRFRLIVAFGLLLAVSLTVLSFARVGFSQLPPTFSYRQAQEWQSTSTLLIRGSDFPFHSGSSGPATSGSSVDPASLAMIAAQYATSDGVRALVRQSGRFDGKIIAAPGQDTSGRMLPYLNLAVVADAPAKAQLLNGRAVSALLSYFESQQVARGVSPKRIVGLQVLNHAMAPKVFQKRSKTLPGVVFVTVMTAVLGLVFVLENFRSRVRPVRELPDRREVSSGA
jgi:hypothetical protein